MFICRSAVVFGIVCLALSARAIVLEVNVPVGGSQTNFTAEQLATIKTLTAADEINKTGAGALLVNTITAIGDFKGTLRISEGCYVPTRPDSDHSVVYYATTKGPLGTCGEAQVIVESGATLFFDLYTQVMSNNFWGVKIHLNGTGADGQAGALVLGGQWNGSKAYNGFYPAYWDIVLDGPTTIAKGGSPGYFHSGCSLDMNGYDLTLVNKPGLKGLESVTNRGHVIVGSDSLEISTNGVFETEVYVAEGVVQTNLTAAQLANVKVTSWDETKNELHKTGPGVLRVCNGYGLENTSLKRLLLSDGVYVMSYNMAGPFGKSASSCTVFVEDGASLFTDEYCNGNALIDSLTIHLAGAGYPGIGGALVLGGNWNPGDKTWYGIYPYGWKVILDADATIMRGYSNGYFGNTAGRAKSTLNMNGHTLTVNNTLRPIKNPAEGFDFRGVELITNPGKVIVNGANTFRIGVTNWFGSTANEIVLTNKASLVFDAGSVVPNWTLTLADTGDQGVNAGWKGPINIQNPSGNLKLVPAAGTELVVSASIAGAGGVKVAGGEFSRTVLSGNNTYAGTTTLSSGSLIFMSKDAAPGWDSGRITGVKDNVGGVIAFAKQTAARPNGWTGAEMWELIKSFRYTSAGANRNWGIGGYVDPDDDFVIDCDFRVQTEGLSYTDFTAMTCQSFGGGRVVLCGLYPQGSVFKPFRVNFPQGNANYASSNVVYSAQDPSTSVWTAPTLNPQVNDFTLENLGRYEMGAWVYMYCYGRSGDYSKPQRLTVGTNTCTDCVRVNGGRALYACGDTDNSAAVITLENGGIISNNVWIASCETATRKGQVGAYVQRGGALRAFLPKAVSNGLSIGGSQHGLGYGEIDGGEFSVGGDAVLTIGNRATSKTVFRQKGGTLDVASANWGRGGEAEIRFSGGTCSVGSLAYVPSRGGQSGDTNGLASMVFDAGVRPAFTGGLALAYRGDSTGVVSCVSGAAVETPFVRRATDRGADASLAVVNFNGGGICATEDAAELLGSGNQTVDRAVVYATGALLEAKAGVTANVSAPLVKPTGKGIASLSYDAFPIRGTVGSGYVIIRGDGVGATASVIYDSTKWQEKITGVEITSPGTGYTWAEAEIFRGSYVTNIPLTVTLEVNETTGGLTKRGAGTIVLNAANTYGGDTVLEEGVLKLGTATALPTDSTIVCKGGAIDLNGQSPTGLTFDVSQLSFTQGEKYTVARNAGAGLPTFVGLPEGWSAVNAGGTIRIRVPTGVMVIVK